MRIIKIILPNQEMVRVEISGDETESRELLSAIMGVNPSHIKGLKDKYGNYFTFSFASKSSSINSEFSDYYHLICSIKDNDDLYCSKKYIYPLNDQEEPHLEREEEYLSRRFIPYNATPQTQYKVLHGKNTTNNKYPRPESSSTSRKGKNNIQFRSSDNLFHHQVYAPIKAQKESNKYLSIINNLIDSKYLEAPTIGIIKNLVEEGNEEVLRVFQFYTSGYMSIGLLAENLNTLIQANFMLDKESNRVFAPLSNVVSNLPGTDKTVMFNIIAKLYSEFFEDCNNELKLIKQLIDLDNEFIKSTFDLYKSNGNSEKLVLKVRQILNKYKPKSTKNSVDLMEDTSQQSIKKEPEICINIIQPKSEGIVIKHTSSIKKFNLGELNTPGRIYFNEGDVKKISEKLLLEEHRIVFKHAVLTKMKEIEVIYQMKVNNFEEQTVIDSIKTFCSRFIEKNVIVKFSDVEKKRFNELIAQQNDRITAAFRGFLDKRDLAALTKNVFAVVEKEMVSDQKSAIVQIDENKIEEELGVESDSSVSEKYNQEDADENGRAVLIKKITSQGWLKETEKDRLIEMIQTDSEEGKKLLDEFQKQNNILALKTKIKKILKDDKPVKVKASKMNPEEILEFILKDKKLIKIADYNTLRQFLKEKDPELLKLFNSYEAPENWEIIGNSLIQFLNKAKHTMTPYLLSVGKKELIDAIKNQKNIEKGEIKKKQIHVIDTLLNEDMIDNSSAQLVKEMIDAENQIIISAFEIFSVTKDHWDFCETIQLFTKIIKGNDNSKLTPDQSPKIEIQSITDYLPEIESLGFKPKEIQLLNSLIISKSNKLLTSSLDSFTQIKNIPELVETLRLIIKKASK